MIVFWATGLVTIVISIALLLTSVMKSLYAYSQSGGRFDEFVRNGISTLYWANPLKPLADVIWPYLPVYDVWHPFSRPSIWYVVLYAATWIGSALCDMGQEESQDIRAAKRAIKRERLQESLGSPGRQPTAEIRLLVDRPRPSFWRSLRRTILAPIFVGLIVAAPTYFFGWN
jgi:hypothetical protein